MMTLMASRSLPGVVEEAGVFFLPSSVYRSDLTPVPENGLRLGLGRLHLPEGLATLRNWLQRNGV